MKHTSFEVKKSITSSIRSLNSAIYIPQWYGHNAAEQPIQRETQLWKVKELFQDGMET